MNCVRHDLLEGRDAETALPSGDGRTVMLSRYTRTKSFSMSWASGVWPWHHHPIEAGCLHSSIKAFGHVFHR